MNSPTLISYVDAIITLRIACTKIKFLRPKAEIVLDSLLSWKVALSV